MAAVAGKRDPPVERSDPPAQLDASFTTGEDESRRLWAMAASFNIRLIYYIWFLFRFMEILSYGPFFDAYLSELAGGGAVFVGLVETVKSATQVAIAFPMGMCADKHSRRNVMTANAVLGVLACLCYVPSVVAGSKPALVLSVITYAIYSRSYGGTMDMMMADAVTKETSLHVTTRKTQLGTLGTALGPFFQMILAGSGAFAAGDSTSEWALPELRSMILSGWLLFPLIAPAQCRFKDMPLRPPEPEIPERLPASPGVTQNNVSSHPVALLQTDDTRTRAARPWWWVPVLLEVFRSVCLLCSGMTTRYFALLFKNLYNLSPVTVALLFVVSPLLQTMAFQAVPYIVKLLGAPHRAALAFHISSCAALLGLAAAGDPISGVTAFFAYTVFAKVLDIPIYSIVLVSVQPAHRGKFFHLLSIKPLTFGASALVGGFIVDAYGYRAAVATTGLFSLVLATPLLLLVGCLS